MLVIKNGKIVTMAGRLIDGGDILVEDNIIREVRDDTSYQPTTSDTVINAEGFFVFPGFIDMHTHCGMDGSFAGDAYRPELFIAPYIKTAKYINPDSADFTDKLNCGITSALVAPFDDRIVGGRCCLVKTAAHEGRLDIVTDNCGMHFSLCGMDNKDYVVYPDSIPAFIKDDLRSAREYLSPETDNKLESPAFSAYEPVLSGTSPAYFTVSSPDQVKIAENIADSFALNAVIVVSAKDPECIEMIESRRFVIDPSGIRASAMKRTAEEMLSRDTGFAISASECDILSVNAGLLVRAGLDMQSGFEAITTTPAEICGLSDRIGALSPGMDADIVIWNGNPLEVLSEVVYSVVNGRIAYR